MRQLTLEERRRVCVAALLAGGLLAAQALDFHPPVSLVEALLPRL